MNDLYFCENVQISSMRESNKYLDQPRLYKMYFSLGHFHLPSVENSPNLWLYDVRLNTNLTFGSFSRFPVQT